MSHSTILFVYAAPVPRMTRFPLFPVEPDKFALICIVCLMLVGAVFMMSRAPAKSEQPAVALPNDALSALPASAVAASGPAAPAPASRYTVKTVAGQPTFFDAANLAGLSASVAHRVIEALRNRVDFRRDWKQENQVSFVFDTKSAAAHTDDPHPAMPAAVRVVTDAGEHDIFLYKNLKGEAFYYTKSGDRARGGFIRYPLAFRRVSSTFSSRRFDPVLRRWQPHDGVDLAAPAGTPVHATANGVVTFAGQQTGYGNVIEIRNRPPYSTLFAHLSRFAKGIHAGAKVRRNEIIGYVGSTGWATGPHLHYEVHVNDVPKNPLTVSLPPAEPLHGKELSRFASRSAELEGLL
ncbi:peptidoglycan DD-metalloendopeptidase family protein [Trinickia sp.]|uniref:peptidoglycan DD-metalloendopeptidase family protein n=1 Tax=Trinickia sp. TaxID=2571163 RepID=UPI003F80F906